MIATANQGILHTQKGRCHGRILEHKMRNQLPGLDSGWLWVRLWQDTFTKDSTTTTHLHIRMHTASPLQVVFRCSSPNVGTCQKEAAAESNELEM